MCEQPPKVEAPTSPLVNTQCAKICEADTSYVEKQIIPWLISHLQMRSIGLQVFLALQSALIVCFVQYHLQKPTVFLIPAAGLIGCLAWWCWDTRNRDVFKRLHRLGAAMIDDDLFKGRCYKDGDTSKMEGLHQRGVKSIEESGRIDGWPGSHTGAIRIVIFSFVIIWTAILLFPILTKMFSNCCRPCC